MANWEAHLEQLSGASSENTIRAYRADFRFFEAWCAGKGFEPLPSQSKNIALYVEEMAGLKAPASIQRAVTGITRVHRLFGHPNPAASEAVAFALRRMLRAMGGTGASRRTQL